MRRGLVLPFALVLSLALAAGLTELYDGLEAALGQVRLENPAQAVNALNRAQSLLREEGALPPVLRDAALTNLQEARQFVAQKSAVDPEARLLLVRHLVGKALYDAFLQAQGEEKAALGQRLARATGLPPPWWPRPAPPPEEARRLLEARYLQAMAEDLGQALAAQSRPQAYLALARAYARYLIVQDSPQSRLKAQDFVQALALVSTGQPFRPEVQRLLGQIQAWRQDLLSSLQPSTPVPPPAQARPPEPAPSPFRHPGEPRGPVRRSRNLLHPGVDGRAHRPNGAVGGQDPWLQLRLPASGGRGGSAGRDRACSNRPGAGRRGGGTVPPGTGLLQVPHASGTRLRPHPPQPHRGDLPIPQPPFSSHRHPHPGRAYGL